MDDENKKTVPSNLLEWLKLLSSILLALAAIGTFVHQQHASRIQQRTEYQKRLWEQQFDLYMQTVKAASTIAGTADTSSQDYKNARIRFEQLFLGEMCLVESPRVEGALVKFRHALVDCEEAPENLKLGKRAILLQLVRELALACRESTEQAWRVHLGELNHS